MDAAKMDEQVQLVEEFIRTHGRATQVQRRFGGARGLVKSAYQKHQKLIDKWGDWSVSQEMELSGYVHPNTVGAVWRHLGSKRPLVHPKYFSRPLWEAETTEVEVVPGAYVKLRKGQSVSRATIKELSDFGLPLQPFFTQLGDLWAVQRPRVQVSCAPIHFLRLGHYGENSCYSSPIRGAVGARAGNFEYSKFNLALIPNSFVGLIYPAPEHHPERPRGRFWGVFGEDGAVVSNNYLFSWRAYGTAITRALQILLGQEQLQVTALSQNNPMMDLHARYVYVNSNSVKAIHPPKRKDEVLSQVRTEVRKYTDTARAFTFRGGRDDDY